MTEYDPWCCPECGWDSSNDDGSCMISCSEHRFVYAVALEYGGNPCEWDEKWKCPECGCVFTYENSNY